MRTAPTAPALAQAREVIGAFLPGHAANRVLERALTDEGLAPSEVDGEQLAALLVGRIYRELRELVPRAPLRRELGRLVRTLRTTHPGDAAPAVAAPTPPEPAPAPPDPAPAPAPPEPEPAPAPPDPAPATTTVAAPAGATARAADELPAQRLATHRPLDPEAVLMALALLDGVSGAAVFDARGRADSVRGEVPEVTSLGPVIAASGGLLERHGALRSLCVTTTGGAVLAIPIPPRWLAVSGAPDMNLGAVYAALTALEEEP